MLFYCLQKKTG